MFLALLYLIIIILVVFYMKNIVLTHLRRNNNKKSFAFLYIGFAISILFVGLFVNQITSVFIDLTDVFYRK
ncbi:hypothetical protein AXY37_06445 [Mammaliicoccus lentus]|jgi:hypothetical protein|uniref:hypothetical protein n=1 Tax=Mammaliicoccus lentus TaxID=42858 RepID=UPI0002F5A477|nr:hypothetical protein [Mammaliicoccus lentus]HBV03211.1 hypothetical protein [Staphylococcus sp.]OAO25101.1 hypothetical protein AXY34_01435 [Mammaliicoccus lentus]OAO31342.1 hypothetical protein AXY37_06445 [Mammaliicoccus lentus]POA07413.1 hypothetical protein CD135_01250 [Mammaliicoccus lentus]QMU10322.1 hypothetical protein H3V22_12205 [Mammaliicoccus lentus]